ncbi:MAG: hydrogenase expression/formation protein HypE [Gemmatimonas sp.]
MTTTSLTAPSIASVGLNCPTPHRPDDCVVLGHGSGGKLSAQLFRERFLPHFDNPVLRQQGDAAVLTVGNARVAMSTDTFVVQPLEFPGGNIGTLAVHGTVNDLAMMGARPLYLTTGFVIEEGLGMDVLDRVIASMATAAREQGVTIVAGDTKVVERGKGDGLFINTTGMGLLDDGFAPSADQARPDDVILLSGPIGRHGMAIMSAREAIGFDTTITSDTAALWPLVDALRHATQGHVHVLRDPTRGGVASALNEIAVASNTGMLLDEASIPVPADVLAACEMLGLDPMYVANEGVLVAIVPPEHADAALSALRAHPIGADAVRIGRVVATHPRMVVMRTHVGGTRIVDLLPGDQLPRIC